MVFIMDARKRQYIYQVIVAGTLSFLLMLGLMLAPKLARAANDDTPYRTEEFSVSTPAQLEVRTSGGHIDVEGTSSNRVVVKMYVNKNGRSLSPSDTDLDDFEIDIRQDGNKVYARARHKNRLGWNSTRISISFVVQTPRQTSTDLRTSGGHVTARNLEGEENLDTSGGHMEMAQLKGTVKAHTSGGHINIDGFEGRMEARTSGGHITAEKASGDMDLKTSGGHITLNEVAGSIEARTSGGNIRADVTELGKYLTLRTSGGNIDITVPGKVGMDLDLRGSRVQTDLQNFNGKVGDDDVEGSLNGGGPKITARTSGGRVSVSYRN